MTPEFDFSQFSQTVGSWLDVVGVFVVLGGVIAASLRALVRWFEDKPIYKTYRHHLGRSILLGLEFLVAGDIIRSVAGNLELGSVVALALIVLIRSLLAFEFEMEVEGRWPWQRSKK